MDTVNPIATIAAQREEIARLSKFLAIANTGFEEYERKFYLTKDRAENAESELSRYLNPAE